MTFVTRFRFRFRVRFAVGLLAGVLLIGAASTVFAQSALTDSTAAQQFAASTILPQTPLPIVIARLIRAVIGVLGIILTLLVLYAGWLYMTAGGEPKKAERAKAIIKNAAIGLLITVSAFTITQFILNSLSSALGLGGISGTSAVQRYSEPLGGALDGRTITDHYPPRDALQIPRNTRIMVTFTEAVNPASIIEGWTAANPNAKSLNFANVKIFESAKTETDALVSAKVVVGVSEDHRSFVFDPVDLLGNASKDTNYSVALKPGILRAGGKALFTGGNSKGYLWTFEVSTIIDLTPPKVVSIQPSASVTHDRNTTVEITFNEAMDPIAASGTVPGFSNIFIESKVSGSSAASAVRQEGTYVISNGYRTVDFTPKVACAKDLCGNIVYCLPAEMSIHVQAKAAKLKEAGSAEALITGGGLDGLADAAGNSLDGGGVNCVGDDKAQGAENDPEAGVDDCVWNFSTNNNVDTRTPEITSIAPGIQEPLVNPDVPVTINFSMPMKISSLTNTNVQLWPDPYYSFWFVTQSEGVLVNGQISHTRVSLSHKSLWRKEDGGYDYYPLVNNDARGINQFCLYPAIGPKAGDAPLYFTFGQTVGSKCGVTDEPLKAYCCNGLPSLTRCPAAKSSVGKTTPVLLPLTPP